MTETRTRSFLLGTMPDAARRQMEEEIFENDEAFDVLQDSLNDLLDEYARGELSGEERRQVEDGILSSPRNRAKLILAQALARRDTAVSPRSGAGWRWGVGGIAAGIAVVVGLGIDDMRLRNAVESTRVSRQPAAPVTSAAPEIASIALQRQLTRGQESVPAIPLPGSGPLLRVDLGTEEVFERYAVEVEATGRGQIWTQPPLARQAGGSVPVWLPAAIMTPGAYEFLLYGMRGEKRELLGSYPCRLEASR